jgi:hypothetical protein
MAQHNGQRRFEFQQNFLRPTGKRKSKVLLAQRRANQPVKKFQTVL